MLLAIKTQQDKITYGENEITPAEEVHMKSKQYSEVKKQASKDA